MSSWVRSSVSEFCNVLGFLVPDGVEACRHHKAGAQSIQRLAMTIGFLVHCNKSVIIAPYSARENTWTEAFTT
jgi:hypothetical protein